MSSTSQPTGFLDLSGELRNVIYALIAIHNGPIYLKLQLSGPSSRSEWQCKWSVIHPDRDTLATAGVCRTIRTEILPLFHIENTFSINASSSWYKWREGVAGAFGENSPLLRHLQFDYDHLVEYLGHDGTPWTCLETARYCLDVDGPSGELTVEATCISPQPLDLTRQRCVCRLKDRSVSNSDGRGGSRLLEIALARDAIDSTSRYRRLCERCELPRYVS